VSENEILEALLYFTRSAKSLFNMKLCTRTVAYLRFGKQEEGSVVQHGKHGGASACNKSGHSRQTPSRVQEMLVKSSGSKVCLKLKHF